MRDESPVWFLSGGQKGTRGRFLSFYRGRVRHGLRHRPLSKADRRRWFNRPLDPDDRAALLRYRMEQRRG